MSYTTIIPCAPLEVGKIHKYINETKPSTRMRVSVLRDEECIRVCNIDINELLNPKTQQEIG
jgi:hypothetical protein